MTGAGCRRARFVDPPVLPAWLEEDLPFRRRMAVLSGGLRMHFLDHGSGPPVLLLHGNPTWCYLWRKVIPLLRGFRVVAPDLVGLGLSDGVPRPSDHTLQMHVSRMVELVDLLDLDDLVVAGQDWGGPLAAGVAARHPDRVRGALFSNTSAMAPSSRSRGTLFHRFARTPLASDVAFRLLAFPVPVLPLVQADWRSMPLRPYLWPLRGWARRAAPLGLARMVPDGPDHPSVEILREGEGWLRRFPGPVALVWGTRDPLLGRALRRMREAVPQARMVETPAGHYLQEEVPEALAEAIHGLR